MTKFEKYYHVLNAGVVINRGKGRCPFFFVDFIIGNYSETFTFFS